MSKKPQKDPNQAAHKLVDSIARKSEKDSAAVKLGRKGGLVGGPSRAKKLSPERRREIACKAARARWWKQKSA